MGVTKSIFGNRFQKNQLSAEFPNLFPNCGVIFQFIFFSNFAKKPKKLRKIDFFSVRKNLLTTVRPCADVTFSTTPEWNRRR